MVSPISFNSPKVYFRGEADNANAANIIGAQGKFTTSADKPDSVELKNDVNADLADDDKKSSPLKTIGKIVGGLVVLLGASFGVYKWKGNKWLNPEAKGFMATIKKAIVKPGEFIDNKMIKPIAGKFKRQGAEPNPEVDAPEVNPE